MASSKEEKGDGGRLFFRLVACDEWCASGFGSGLLLFVIYINHLDENTQVMISKFANYTKVDGIVDSVVKNSTGIFDRLIDAK